jgi:hypothetical protein
MSGSQQPYMSTRQRVVVLDFPSPSAAEEWSGTLDANEWAQRQVIDLWDAAQLDEGEMDEAIERMRSSLRSLRQWVVDDE